MQRVNCPALKSACTVSNGCSLMFWLQQTMSETSRPDSLFVSRCASMQGLAWRSFRRGRWKETISFTNVAPFALNLPLWTVGDSVIE